MSADILIASIDRIEEILATYPPDDPNRLGLMQAFATALHLRSQRTGSEADLDRAIYTAEEVVIATPSDGPERHGRVWTLGLIKQTQFQWTGALKDSDGVMDAMNEALQLTPVDHPERPERLIRFGEAVLDRFKHTESLQDLNRAISVKEEALPSLSSDHEDLPCCLDMLGNAYHTRYERCGVMEDLHRAISLKERAVLSLDGDFPERARYLTNLFNALHQRFEELGGIEDLNRSIVVMEEAVGLTPPDDPLQERRLLCLSSSLSSRFELTGSLDDVDAAIRAARNANESALRDNRPPLGLTTLAIALYWRFSRSGLAVDADEAINILNHKLLDGAAKDASVLNNLGCLLMRRFERFGSQEDVDLAFNALVEAVDSTPPADPDIMFRLNNLVLACQYRFECTGLVEDLEYALCKGEEAVRETLAKPSERATSLMNLGNLLQLRFTEKDSVEDIDRAIGLLKESLDLIPDNPNTRATRATHLLHLGGVYRTLYSRHGSFGDLVHAIDETEHALDMMPTSHSDLPAVLDQLASAYEERFLQTGSLGDLNLAISLLEQGGIAIPEDHRNKPRFMVNLSAALQRRFKVTGSLEDITRAISAAEKAEGITLREDTERGARLCILACGFLSRYQTTDSLDDLRRAITITEDALQQQLNRLQVVSNFNNLSLGLFFMHKHTKSTTDLDRAIEFAQKAVEGAPSDYKDKAWFLNTLCEELLTRFEMSGKRGDLDEAVAFAEDAINIISASPTTRIDDAFKLASRLTDMEPRYAARLYRLGVMLLPTVSPRTISSADRQRNLSQFTGQSSTAAAFALEQGESAFDALALLEIGRGVLANMQLELRSDVTTLEKEHPELATKFSNLRDTLDSSNYFTHTIADPRNGLNHSLQYSDAVEFGAVIKKIQSLKGFERFLLGPSEPEILSLASQGPIIVLNAARRRCDAFVVSSSSIKVIPLPELRYPDDVLWHANALLGVIHGMDVQDYSPSIKTLKTCLRWLWDVAVGPILDELGFTDTPPQSTVWPRVWWMPTGILSVFPWHAAGRHAIRSTKNAIDRVVSSYTPTLKALSHMRDKALRASPAKHNRALLIAMPKTENKSSLPSADVEVQGIFDLLPSSSTSKTILRDPTKEEVLAEIPTSDIVHFACHGESSPTMSVPSQSCLFLRDWQTNPFSVMDLMALKFDKPSFAYLSSCDSASNKTLLLEEAMHLAGACYMAGFTYVVGTMWHIRDMQSANVALEVYSFMLGDEGGVDLEKSAEGLHHAVRRLRDQTRDDPILWAAYIHVGV